MIDRYVFLGCAIAFGISIVTPPASQPVPVLRIREKPPLSQWQCTRQEFREHAFACKHRGKAI